MNSIIIILGTVLVVLIVYMLFQSYFDGEHTLITQTTLEDAVNPIHIPSPNSTNFSYGIWIFVSQWLPPGAVEAESRIFTRQDEVGLHLKSDAGLEVRFADTGTKDVKAATMTGNYTSVILTDNFPIQKWVHVGLVVDGDKFDGYIDGKMVKSIELKDNITPVVNANDGKAKHKLEFGQGNTMMKTITIAEHKRRTYAMDPKAMWDLYMKGNGTNGLSNVAGNMNVNLSVMKDGVESSNYSLW
jgi:hypothetical protein